MTVRFQPCIGRTISLCKVFSLCWSPVFPAAPVGAGFASDWHATSGAGLSPNGFADTSSCAPASLSKSAPLCTRLIPPATVAPRSSAACPQTAAAPNGSRLTAASSSGHALSIGRRSSPTAAAGWSVTKSRSSSVTPTAAKKLLHALFCRNSTCIYPAE